MWWSPSDELSVLTAGSPASVLPIASVSLSFGGPAFVPFLILSTFVAARPDAQLLCWTPSNAPESNECSSLRFARSSTSSATSASDCFRLDHQNPDNLSAFING